MQCEITEDVGGEAGDAAQTCPAECCKCSTVLIRKIVSEALEQQRAREAAEEAALWASCFGPGAPSHPKARLDQIVRIASGRAFLTIMNANGRAQIEPTSDSR